MWKIWVRDSYRAKWRVLNTRDFEEAWEADSFINKSLDLGKEGEAVSLPVDEAPYVKENSRYA